MSERIRIRSWHLAAPAVVTLVFAFRAGGFFPGVTSTIAVVLALSLAARITIASAPFSGWSAGLSIAAGAMALLAAWTLLSAGWSGAPARALIEFNRTLVYVLLLVVMGGFGYRRGDLDLALRWVGAAIIAVCLVALLTRLLPEELPTTPGRVTERLSFPLTYWNAMGLLCALGVVLATHLTASERAPAAVRVAGAGALPVVALTLYFTFSRGGILMAGVGVLLYAVLAHPRGLPAALIAAGAPTYLAVRAAYDAELLARPGVSSAAAHGEAVHVLTVLVVATLAAIVLRTLALLLDRRLVAVAVPRRRAVLGALAATALAALALTAVAVDAPARIEAQREAFVEGNVVPTTGDLRDRFSQAGNNGRLEFWRVDRDAFAAAPFKGEGAGTFSLRWERTRPAEIKVSEGHSLYLETAGELGVVGVGLLGVALLAVLWAGARRWRGPERHAGAAFLATSAILLIHAGVDWDWEMPALFAWWFGAGGLALARDVSSAAAAPGGPPRLVRLVAGLACLLLAVTPALMAISQGRLNRGVSAFERRDCTTAIDAALDSIDALSVRAEPYELLGYCDARAGQHGLAVAAMRAARARDPENWHYSYGLAVTQALAGQDPTAAITRASRLNPRSGLVRDLRRGLRSKSPERRRRAAGQAKIPFE